MTMRPAHAASAAQAAIPETDPDGLKLEFVHLPRLPRAPHPRRRLSRRRPGGGY